MPQSGGRYVKPSRSGSGWVVMKDGHVRATVRTGTRDEAVAAARAALQREGGGELRVKDEFGKLTEFSHVLPVRGQG